MHLALVFVSADTVDPQTHDTTLSQQSMMERLVAGLDGRSQRGFRCADSGLFKAACAWRGLTCDADGRVVMINLQSPRIGTLDLDCIPPSVGSFFMSNKAIPSIHVHGTINTAMLPPVLRELDLSSNACDGTLDLASLPAPLRRFDVQRNRFTGSCDLTALPPKLKELFLSSNRFSGSVCLAKLPDTLRTLWLRDNALSGELDFSNFPPDLNQCLLDRNAFSGEFRFPNVRDSKHFQLIADRNNFSGTAVIPSATHRVTLHATGVVAVVDTDGTPNPRQPVILGALKVSPSAGGGPGDFQLLAMRHFYAPMGFEPKDVSKKFYHLLKHETMDCCDWHNVGCVNGIVFKVHIAASDYRAQIGKPTVVDLGWMPPTVQYAAICYVRAANGWATAWLPREMRFLSLQQVENFPWNGAPENTIDLRTLPAHMEELFVVGGWYNGAVYVDSLPASVRLIQITNAAVNTALIHFEALPQGFEGLCLSNTESMGTQKKKERPRIRGTGREQADPRVMTAKHQFQKIPSKYVHMFASR